MTLREAPAASNGSLQAPLRAYLNGAGHQPRYREVGAGFSTRDERRLRRFLAGTPNGKAGPVAVAEPGGIYRKARLVRLQPARTAPRSARSSRLRWLLTGAVAVGLVVLLQRAAPFGPQMVFTGDQAAALAALLVAFGFYLRGRFS